MAGYCWQQSSNLEYWVFLAYVYLRKYYSVTKRNDEYCLLPRFNHNSIQVCAGTEKVKVTQLFIVRTCSI